MAFYPRQIDVDDPELLGLNWIVEHEDPVTKETHVVVAARNSVCCIESDTDIMPIGMDQVAAMKMANLLNEISERIERDLAS